MMYVLTPEQMRAADAPGDRGRRRRRADARRRRTRSPAVAETHARGRRSWPSPDPETTAATHLPRSRCWSGFERAIYAQPAHAPSHGAQRSGDGGARAAAWTARAFPATRRRARAAHARRSLAIGGTRSAPARVCRCRDGYSPLAPRSNGRRARCWQSTFRAVSTRERCVDEPAVRARVTVTLGAPKPGLLLSPGRECRRAVVGAIGMRRRRWRRSPHVRRARRRRVPATPPARAADRPTNAAPARP